MKNRYILKNLCRKIYLAGAGDFWYEEGVIGNDKSFLYVMICYALFFIYVSMTILEIIAAVFADLPKDEKSDSVTFAVSHTIVMIKIFSVMSNRKLVKELNYKMVGICEAYEVEKTVAENYKIMKMNVYAYVTAVYGSCACFVFEGIRKMQTDFDKNNYGGNEEFAANKLQTGLIEGIVMHRDLLRLSKDIDRSFGTVMALQVCQSSGSAVSLLLQIALSSDLTFVAGMKIIFFVAALFFLLALFLCNAGEITYQASLLSDSIFYCGWHACPMRRNLRRLVLMACASAQRPLVMKAFKMLQLTYGTFLTVVRSTYSVFALFYAQNE
ncbi:hypothetical protein MSG28_012345 [Choristoneura fumiferana]|uniref:Uncharacterized protein n=1 Tax=Choristoneura fumiferana TaxID=7141 RepID=A0ACC0KCT4_CHOFU|nr:hypothetical protein MSG28_012345 [Choristoneura fumiferana]